MDVSREDVLRCARLAHLSLREDEIEPMRQAMERMLRHAASLDELPLEGVEPMLSGLLTALPRREDEPGACLTQAEALDQAPIQDRGMFVVPRVL